MNKLLAGYCRLLEWLLVAMLALMVLLVFGNVVLRYAFNSGITVRKSRAGCSCG
jgi:TRAP-type C4-dicarboxylate transport system permease small subunit